MSLPGVTPSFEQHHISCISSFSFYGRLLTPLSIQQAERLVRWIFIQISTFSVRFFFLFYSTCDTFCEALLEAEEKSEGKYTADMLETALSEITATYDYSVQNNQLTLTEREYGDQLFFDKK